RKVGSQFFVQLAFPVVTRGMLEVRWSIVATAEVELQSRAVDPDCDPAEAPIPRRIGAVIAEQVVKRAVLLHPGKHLAKVVRIEECFSAGISRQGDQRFLGGSVGVECAGY